MRNFALSVSRVFTPRTIALGMIRLYQARFAGRPSPCRFYPSCSNYGLEAISSFGLWKGGLLTARRILRCRPGGPSGIDLVPECNHDSSPRGHTRKVSNPHV